MTDFPHQRDNPINAEHNNKFVMDREAYFKEQSHSNVRFDDFEIDWLWEQLTQFNVVIRWQKAELTKLKARDTHPHLSKAGPELAEYLAMKGDDPGLEEFNNG